MKIEYSEQQAIILKGIAQSLLDLSSPTVEDLNRLLKMFSLEDNISSNDGKRTFYAFLHCPDYKQGGYITVSIHSSRDGALKAMNDHKKYCLENYPHMFGADADWMVDVSIVLD
jgi:hypothetical protein